MSYQGSKRRFRYQILLAVLDRLKTIDWQPQAYYEPFCGALSLSLAFDEELPLDVPFILCDINPFLIALWQKMKEPGWTEPQVPWTRDFFDYCKNTPLASLDLPLEAVAWAGFLFSYRGIFLMGFNNDRNIYDCNLKILRETQQRLKRMARPLELRQGDYLEQMVGQDGQPITNSLVICDPPYQNKSRYDRHFINKFSYSLFWEVFLPQLKRQNNQIFVCETENHIKDKGLETRIIWRQETTHGWVARRNKEPRTECVIWY